MLLLLMNVNPMKMSHFFSLFFARMHAFAQHQASPSSPSGSLQWINVRITVVGKPLQLPGAAWNMIQPSGKSSFANVAELPAANHHNLIQTDIYNVRFFLSLCVFSVKQRF